MKYMIPSILLFSSLVQAKTIRIAIIDTGYYMNDVISPFKPCDNFKYDRDFTKDKTMEALHPHGQNILHTVADGLQNVDYCVINIKALTIGEFDQNAYFAALNYVKTLDIDIVNMSISGEQRSRIESNSIKTMLKKNVKVIVAAGNRRKNLDKGCSEYPTCVDKRVISVGCLKEDNKTKCSYSNRGKRVSTWEIGNNITAGGITMSGTSQAAAVYTNKLIKKLAKERIPANE